MMQSAAVLPTESPVKSLPEILGVPLQRKTFCTLLFLSIVNLESVGVCNLCCRVSLWGEGFRYSKSTEDEERRLNLAVLDCHVQANDVSCCSYFNERKSALNNTHQYSPQ